MIGFNATLVSHGDEHKLHHLHGLSVEKLDGFQTIGPKALDYNPRYGLGN